MIGITNYIKHDLEGIYTAELLRGGISMLCAIVISSLVDLKEAQTYILIVALYGLRPITHAPFFKRLGFMILSLMLLSLTLQISLYLGQQKLYFHGGILAVIFSCLTVYALARKPMVSGTIMFMSVFAIINFGMGVIDTEHLITPLQLLYASIYGSISVLIAVILVPMIRFHWCLMINHCFYSQLKSFSKIMSHDDFYESFTDLPESHKNKILMHQSSLMNITSFVQDKVRLNLYLHILNGLMLICYWPSTASDKTHLKTINNIRSATFTQIYHLLDAKKSKRAMRIAQIKLFITDLQKIPYGEFCNGEMIRLTIDVLESLISITTIDNKNKAVKAME